MSAGGAGSARWRVVGGALALALAVAGCGSGASTQAGGGETGAGDAAATEPTPTEDLSTEAAETEAAETEQTSDEGDAATVAVGETDLGSVLLDGDGATLYLFTNDTGNESTCYDDCESSWPPLLTEGDPQAGDGVDAALLATTEREDGSTQVTYDGHPLYYFSGDEAAGDVNGQGVGGVWFAVTPEGEQVSAADSSSTGGRDEDDY